MTMDITSAQPFPPIDVPQREWPDHPLLKRARLNRAGDRLDWPGNTREQLRVLRNISLWGYEGDLYARVDAEFNFDFFVDAGTDENAPAQPPIHQPDRQRYYTRVTNGGFHIVGAFCAATVDGRRRYFQWLPGGWAELGLSGFLYVRDNAETRFSEVSPTDFSQMYPSASALPVAANDEPNDDEPIDNESIDDGPKRRSSRHRLDVVAPAEDFAESATAAPHSIPKATAPAVPLGAIQRGISMALATVALRGRKDLLGADLIDHAARVADSFDVVTESVRHCAAWLHDVIECSDLVGSDLLNAGLLPEIVDVVLLLSRDADTAEDEWLLNIAAHPDAHAVKLAAIDDNEAPWRLRMLDSAIHREVRKNLARTRAALSTELAN